MRILRTLLASTAVLAAGLAVLIVATDHFQAFTAERARRVAAREQPVAVPDVTLETQTGRHVDLAALRGHWLVMDFIYTHCPSVCVALGTEFARLQDKLAGPIAAGEVMLVSVSFDTGRDGPRELTAYLQRSRSRGAGWLATRPVTSAERQRLLQRFGVTVIRNDIGGYTHNAAIHIVDPRGRLVAILDQGKPERVAQFIRSRLQ